MAAVAIVIGLILIVVGVRSCEGSAQNSALNDYNDDVASLIRASDQTASQFFSQLSRGAGEIHAISFQDQINETGVSADSELSHARSIDVPAEVEAAQRNLLLALQLRRDAIANIATEIQPALVISTSTNAIDAIAREMGRFYSSDVR